MSKHTPGPWIYADHPNGRGGYVRGGEPLHKDDVSPAIARIVNRRDGATRANAARIVDCVNAMEGIEDPAAFVDAGRTLEREWRKSAIAAADKRKRVAALVEAAKDLLSNVDQGASGGIVECIVDLDAEYLVDMDRLAALRTALQDFDR